MKLTNNEKSSLKSFWIGFLFGEMMCHILAVRHKRILNILAEKKPTTKDVTDRGIF